jgi:hypothetical protein
MMVLVLLVATFPTSIYTRQNGRNEPWDIFDMN